jgi:hypothetical protein
MANRNPPWSREENEATVASYFAMLEARLRGERVNQAKYNRQLRQVLNDRTKAAVEFKHQNISAVLIDVGVPYISGYKPASNYQRDLRDVVIAQLNARRVLREVIAGSVLEVPAVSEAPDPEAVFSEVPPSRGQRQRRESERAHARPAVDYVRLEANNIALGLAGEKFVLEVEQKRLERAGHSRLAAQVSHVSVERGDGLGFDILSFETDTRERLIEVKTTKYGEYTPFFVSRNELAVSKRQAGQYHLYRLHSFGAAPRLFRLVGALDESFALEPASYLARVG